MKRRDLLRHTTAGSAILAAGPFVRGEPAAQGADRGPLRAGFARQSINPPLGTFMMGFGGRDATRGCQSIHDDIHVRALLLEQGEERFLLLAYDLCFLGREEADRFKGAIGREFDLLSRQILINASHSHVGPAVGTWYWAGYRPADRAYVNRLEAATREAVRRARADLREATMSTGVGTTELPLSRRRPDGKGGVTWAPYPAGYAYRRLPVCLVKDGGGRPVCLLFSASVHPSIVAGWDISAEYPGVACGLLDQHLGATVAMFVQGAAGDSKPRVVGHGLEKWRQGTWEDVHEAGSILARDTLAVLAQPLSPVEPAIRTGIEEMHWPLRDAPARSELESIVGGTKPEARPTDIRCQWASRMLAQLDRGEQLPASAGVLLHGVQLGRGLRMVGMEGEPVAAWGPIIEKPFTGGVTFPLGYCNGQGLYLPVSSMIPEGGYEVDSAWEYGFPAPLAAGMEEIVLGTVDRMKRRGIA